MELDPGRVVSILVGLAIALAVFLYLCNMPGLLSVPVKLSLLKVLSKVLPVELRLQESWSINYTIVIAPKQALMIALDALNGTLPELSINNTLIIVQERGYKLLDLFRTISRLNASCITPSGWTLLEAALSIAYLPYRCYSTIINPWPVDEEDRLNLSKISINFTLCLPTRYFLHELPYPPSGRVEDLSCNYKLIDSWTECRNVTECSYVNGTWICRNVTKCVTYLKYRISVLEHAVVYNGSSPMTCLKVGDYLDCNSSRKPFLNVTFEVTCVNSCNIELPLRSWILDTYSNPLGEFTRTFTLVRGKLKFTGTCSLDVETFQEPSWIFEKPKLPVSKEELVRQWTWLWIGVAISRKIRDLTLQLLRGNWSRYWTYEYTWLTTLAICSLKRHMDRWEVLNITYNALTTYIPTAAIHTRLWNKTAWAIVLAGLGKDTPKTFTIWHIINTSNYRIVIVDPWLYDTLCAGNNFRAYNNITLLPLHRLNFNAVGLKT